MSNNDLIKTENEILDIMASEIEKGVMDAERARLLSRIVLESLTIHMSHAQILEQVKEMNKKFPELLSIVVKMQNEENEKIKTSVTQHVEKLIREGKLDQASKLLKETLK